MGPTEFASRDPLPAAGEPRFPRPSRLDTPLEFGHEKAEKAAAAARARTTVEDLLEHIPRDRRAARTLARPRARRGRDRRRRGGLDQEPPGAPARHEADGRGPRQRRDGHDERRRSSTSRGWSAATAPGTRLLLTGKLAPPPRRGFNVSDHAETGDQVATGEDMATYPASDGLTSVQIAALVHEHKDRMRDVLEPLPARIRALERLPDRSAAIDAAHFGDQEGGRRRLAFDEFLLLQIALLRRRALRREGARGDAARSPPSELTARWLEDSLPFTPTGDQTPRHGHGRRGHRAGPPDAAPADGRGRLRQDRRRALRDAQRGRVRRPGRAHGADRDARRAALPDAPEADAG